MLFVFQVRKITGLLDGQDNRNGGVCETKTSLSTALLLYYIKINYRTFFLDFLLHTCYLSCSVGKCTVLYLCIT